VGNPRNIKRIFNVLSLTAVIINKSEKEVKKNGRLLDNVGVKELLLAPKQGQTIINTSKLLQSMHS